MFDKIECFFDGWKFVGMTQIDFFFLKTGALVCLTKQRRLKVMQKPSNFLLYF